MPLSSDSYLAENIYVELPGSFESCEAPTVPALPRRLTDNNQRERKRSKSETITGGEFDNDKEGNEDEVRANWRNLFNGKWPYLTPLFYKSEEDTLSKLQEQTKNLENTFHLSSTSLNSSQWNDSIRDYWTGSERNVIEAYETESSDRMSDDKPKRCEKNCRRFLCVFLGFSVLGAILAGIGLSLILTSYKHNRQPLYQEETLVDVGLSGREETYLTKTFCDVVKVLLRGVEFPVDKGLQSCQTFMRLVKDSEDVNIILQISPNDGFTIKEKLKRALSEAVITEGAYRVKDPDRCIHVGGPKNHIHCETNHQFNDTIASVSSNVANDVWNIGSADQGPRIESSSANKIEKNYDSSTVRLEPSNIGIEPSKIRPESPSIRLEPSRIQLEPSSSGTFSTKTVDDNGQFSTQSVDHYDEWQTLASVEPMSTPIVPVDLQSDIRDQILVSPVYPQANSLNLGNLISRDWLDQISPSLTSLAPGPSSISTLQSVDPFNPNDIVTNYPGFEEQTKNNTVATTGLDLNTRPNLLEQTTPNTYNDVSNTQTDNFGNNSTDRPMEFTSDTRFEPFIIDRNNGDFVIDTQTETPIDTAKANVNQPLPNNANTKGLSEADLMFRFNLYGPSGSKNYLRFPIVTGSNGKFLFSPLSNKDSIDIATKTDKTKSPTTVEVISVSDSGPTSTDINQSTDAIPDNSNNNLDTIKKGPKPMVVDWKTPPTAKPTSFPNGWNVQSNGLEKEGPNDDPSGPKVIFRISKRSDSV